MSARVSSGSTQVFQGSAVQVAWVQVSKRSSTPDRGARCRNGRLENASTHNLCRGITGSEARQARSLRIWGHLNTEAASIQVSSDQATPVLAKEAKDTENRSASVGCSEPTRTSTLTPKILTVRGSASNAPSNPPRETGSSTGLPQKQRRSRTAGCAIKSPSRTLLSCGLPDRAVS